MERGADARLEIREPVPNDDFIVVETPFPNSDGHVKALCLRCEEEVSLQFRDNTETAVGDPIVFGGGNGDFVWPAFETQDEPDFVDAGDVSDAVITRGDDGGDPVDVIMSLFYNAN